MLHFKTKLQTSVTRLLLACLLTTSVCMAQPKQEALTNANVVAMVKAGLPKSVIIATIQNSGENFDLSSNALIALKRQGVNDEVLSAMAGKVSPANTSVPASNAAPKPMKGESGLSRLESGIYYADESAGKQTALEASVFSQSKMGSGILTAMTYGIAKTKAKAVLSGAQANFQINNSNPVFYFVFPHNNSGAIGNESASNGWYSNATSPNEFLLVKFKVVNTSRQKGREVVTGTFGSYSGFSGGIDDENKIAYRFTKLSSGIYKVYFEAPLKAGEYAFLFAGTAASTMGTTTSQKAFDFSIAQ